MTSDTDAAQAGGPVVVLGSYAPSLVNFRASLIEALVARGYRVLAVAPDVDEETAGKLRALGAEPRSLPIANTSLDPRHALRSLGALKAFFRETRPRAVIAYTVMPVVLGALAAKAVGVPRFVALITGLGYAFSPGREPKRLLSRTVASFLYRAALKRADVAVFQNPDDPADLRRMGVLPRSTRVAIVNGSGVDIERFAPAPLPPQPSFVMIARLIGDKGVREYGAAAVRLKAEMPQVRVALVGYLDPSPDSLTQAELDALVASGLEYRGRMGDVRPALADASVYVLPSFYREGTPRSSLEAMAMGRAIVTTDAPGCRETVAEGVNGLLVPPRDADALYRAMRTLAGDEERTAAMGAASRRIAEERFDVRKVNAEFLAHAGL